MEQARKSADSRSAVPKAFNAEWQNEVVISSSSGPLGVRADFDLQAYKI